MTLQEIKTWVTSFIPALGGNTVLSGTSWDANTYPTVEKTLTASTALTLANKVAGKTKGSAFITGAGFPLTIDGNPVLLKPSGVTIVSVSVQLDNSLKLNSDAELGINTYTASQTATLADAGSLARMNIASANTFTVPPNSSVAFPTGTQLLITQTGAGQTTITPGAGVTINAAGGALKTRVQYSTVSLIKTGADLWLLSGDATT